MRRRAGGSSVSSRLSLTAVFGALFGVSLVRDLHRLNSFFILFHVDRQTYVETAGVSFFTARETNNTHPLSLSTVLSVNSSPCTEVASLSAPPPDWDISTIKLIDFPKRLDRRAQLTTVQKDQNFLRDALKLHHQLSVNYNASSSCRRIRLNETSHPMRCYGLGSTFVHLNNILKDLMVQNQTVVGDIDQFSCPWFQRDTTKSCETMFGDCYLPSLSGRWFGNATSECFSVEWFKEKWGNELYFAAHLDWMLPFPIGENTGGDASSCLALHIRRGDVCHALRRKCLNYGRYYQAVKAILHHSSEPLKRMVVMTDGDDFPLDEFRELVPEVVFSTDTDRHKYSVEHILRKPIRQRWPEHRDLGNSTSELLQEMALAAQCTAMVGTFSASISGLVFAQILARTGRVPPFYSLESCLNQVSTLEIHEKGCQPSWL